MNLELAGIVMKRLQNDAETKIKHRRVKVSCFYSISFPHLELLHTIVTFLYKLLYLRFVLQNYISPLEREEIARSLGLSGGQVATWFRNRRAKY